MKERLRRWISVPHALAAVRKLRPVLVSRGILAPEPHDSTATTTLALGGRRIFEADYGRYFYLVLKWLALSGYAASVPESLALYHALRTRYGRLVMSDEALAERFSVAPWHLSSLIGRHPPADVVTLSDLLDPGYTPGVRPFIEFVLGAQREQSTCDIVFPYTMHPRLYHDGSYIHERRVARETASSPRRIRMFFAGNFERQSYSAPIIFRGRSFSSRHQIIATLLQEQDAVELIKDSSIAVDPGGAELNKCVVLDTATKRVADEDWLQALRNVDFFLSPPGMEIPFSHNIIEAMAMGAVPVTEYGSLFDPPLQHGVTCIEYSSIDLQSHVLEILSMPRSRIADMRMRVIDYYEKHLHPDAFGRKLRGLIGHRRTVRVGFPYL